VVTAGGDGGWRRGYRLARGSLVDAGWSGVRSDGWWSRLGRPDGQRRWVGDWYISFGFREYSITSEVRLTHMTV
jgi:hypothetical protein